MFSKFGVIALTAATVLVLPYLSYGQDSLIVFGDDFESYAVGMRIACMDTAHGNIHWRTWSGVPCDPVEDPLVTNTNAYSGTNSVWIQQSNDLVKPIPDFTAGRFSIRFRIFIPENFTASWGQLASFDGSGEWGFYARFNPFGNGTVNAGGWDAAQFTFAYDTWMSNELKVDLNTDSAAYYFQGNLVHSWQWTRGSDGDTIPLQLSITDIWGGIFPNSGPTQYYVDDYVLERLDTTIAGVEEFSFPKKFSLDQNYPNPFNPSTAIRYQIPRANHVTLKVCDILGRDVATLVDEVKTPGNHIVQFDGSALASGVYFYRLNAGQFVETKRLVLLK